MLWVDTRFSDPLCRTTVEMRAGATGFSVEVNMIQVFWTADQAQAEALYYKLVSAMRGD